jgi:hypothetical protein
MSARGGAEPRGDSIPLAALPASFRDEEKALNAAGIASWDGVRTLDELQLSRLARSGRATARNLRRLQGMAVLICDLDLAPADAALLLHAGVATVSALAASTPQDLVTRTGRLERQLRSGRPPVVDLPTAQRWIQRAKHWQTTN